MSYFDDLDRFLPMEDYVTVTRHVPGQQDPDTGVPQPASETQVLMSACDVQDDAYRLRRSSRGDETKDADAVIFLPDAVSLSSIREEDNVTVEYAHVLMRGTVVEVSRFESRILVKWQ